MSPSEVRKSLWSKKARKRQENWQRRVKNWHVDFNGCVVVGLTVGTEEPYVEVIGPGYRTGKVYLPRGLQYYTFVRIARALCDQYEIEVHS